MKSQDIEMLGESQSDISRDSELIESISNAKNKIKQLHKTIGLNVSESNNRWTKFKNILEKNTNDYIQITELEFQNHEYENESYRSLINNILELLGDPSGIDTIQDLYTRNAIVDSQNKNVPRSPKDIISLKSKKKHLLLARDESLKKLIPRLSFLLEMTSEIQNLLLCVEEDVATRFRSQVGTLPDNQFSSQVLNIINENEPSGIQSQEKLDKLTELLIEKKDLLFNNSYIEISQERLDNLQKVLLVFKEEYSVKQRMMSAYMDYIVEFLEKLGVSIDNEMNQNTASFIVSYVEYLKESVNQKHLPITHKELQKANNILRTYEMMYYERSEQKDQLMKQCEQFWKRLEENDDYIKTFKLSVDGLTDNTLITLDKELNSLKERETILLNLSIENIKYRVFELWEILQVNEPSREHFNETFETFNRIGESQNALQYCKETLYDLESRNEIFQNVKTSIAELEDIVKEKCNLEYSSRNPSRLLSKNSYKILLQEERIRNKIARKVPKIMEQLKAKLLYAEEIHNTPFLFEGHILSKILSKLEKYLLNNIIIEKKLIFSSPGTSECISRNPSRITKRGNSVSPLKGLNKSLLFKTPERSVKADSSSIVKTLFVDETYKESEYITGRSIVESKNPLFGLNSPVTIYKEKSSLNKISTDIGRPIFDKNKDKTNKLFEYPRILTGTKPFGLLDTAFSLYSIGQSSLSQAVILTPPSGRDNGWNTDDCTDDSINFDTDFKEPYFNIPFSPIRTK